MDAGLSPGLRERLAAASLEDRWTTACGRVYLSGTQALVRLLMLQRQRDALAGHATAGYLSGYRGSPLGTVDQVAWGAQRHLQAHDIHFQPGLNEDLAATAVWGTQQVNMRPGARAQGVFALWYGKGPGVDRCGDVFKHANAAGTSALGGVVVACGDDHGARSSTLPHQSDHLLKACMIPVLYPATVQEYLDLGAHAYAMSRYAGVWVGFKCATEVVESSASVIVDPARVQVRLPADFAMPPGGLNIRWPDPPLDMEARLLDHKLYAVLAYARANGLNQTVLDAPQARFGIIASGKAYLDTRQALEDLGLDAATCQRIGLRLMKCALVWPLEPQAVGAFAEGLEEILVIEEKRQVIEYQLKEELFQWQGAGRRVPRVIGKFDEKDGGEWSVPQGNWILPAHFEFTPALVARAVAARLGRLPLPAEVRARMDRRLAVIAAREQALAAPRQAIERMPYFCPGCPHNTSTRVPEGARATAGIGCHYMATWMNRSTETYCQMGGEGVSWVGQAPFRQEAHVFANLGDGTYFHSGVLAVRAAVAAGVNITFKILYNDAVAMTGGQAVDGVLGVPRLTRQLAAEGVGTIVVVSNDPARLRQQARSDPLAEGVRVEPRARFDAVQESLRGVAGVSALVFDQTCAAELRRRRKRGRAPDPAVQVIINQEVCEACGDCGRASNCLAVEPVATPLGLRRRVNRSACNKDLSCLDGFCPSFVTLEGGAPARARLAAPAPPPTPEPAPARAHAAVWGILTAGVGGTGVVTIGQWLGMAGHLEGRAVSVLDVAGLAQKGGAVLSHVQIGAPGAALHATRIAAGEADLLLGCDLVVSAGTEVLARLQPGRTHAVLNHAEVPTAGFLVGGPPQPSAPELLAQLRSALSSADELLAFDAQALAQQLFGDALCTNALVLGAAWQRGWIPLQWASLRRAVELNGAAVAANLLALEWGRAMAHDARAAMAAAHQDGAGSGHAVGGDRGAGRGRAGARVNAAEDGQDSARPGSLEQLIEDRSRRLATYQDASLARHFRQCIEQVRVAEERCGGTGALSRAAAEGLYQVLAIKDEYEVARQLRDPDFLAGLRASGGDGARIVHHLAPPWIAPRDPRTGHPRKMRFGPWVGPVLDLVARLRGLRGTALDVFGWQAERRAERALALHHEALLARIARELQPGRLDLAVRLATVVRDVRGFGHIKAAAMQKAARQEAELLVRWEALAAGGGAVPGPSALGG